MYDSATAYDTDSGEEVTETVSHCVEVRTVEDSAPATEVAEVSEEAEQTAEAENVEVAEVAEEATEAVEEVVAE